MKVEVDQNQRAIEALEAKLAELKFREEYKFRVNPDIYDDLRDQVKKEAGERYDKFISDPKRGNQKELQILAYESILYDERRLEQAVLNKKRQEEIEKNRPPNPGWWSNCTNEFHKEVYRNRVDLKPRNTNKTYLEILKDKSIY